ncbi:MAG: DUF4097 domain-containing protein [Acholeplasmatales bacterium]|nr:DUF4097 domain-containing protein [Acholeplasmatales bacterium]
MRKLLKFLLFVGIIVLVAGGVCIGIAFATNGFNNVEVTEETKEIEEDFTSMYINLVESDIEFYESTDGKTKLVYNDTEKFEQEIKVEDGALSIKEKNSSKWYDHIFNWNTKTLKYKLYLTTNTFEGLKIVNTTGDVKIDTYDFDRVSIETSTGDINLSKINVTNDLEIEITTGFCKLSNIDALNLNVDITTGDIELYNVMVTNEININSTTGDILFDRIDANTINIDTTTGDVEGSILTGKTFYVSTTTGDVDYPNTTGGKCTINTTTGDVDVLVIEK